MDKVSQYIDKVIDTEGGYVNHPSDRGGPTKYGITEATARRHGYVGDMRDLSRARAVEIYTKEYWEAPNFKGVALLSEKIAFELFDSGVNCGTGRSARWLQEWLNIYNRQERDYKDITVDGKIGPNTLTALSHYLTVRSQHGEHVLFMSLNCEQAVYYKTIAQNRPANEDFMFGWVYHRVLCQVI